MNNRLTRMNHCSTKHEQQQNLQPTTQVSHTTVQYREFTYLIGQCHMRGCTQLPTGKTNFCSDTHAQEHVTTPRTPKTFRSHTAQPKQCKLRGCSELKDAKSGFCSVAHKQLHATHKATANAARKEQQRASEPKSHSAMTKKCHHMGCDLPPKANTNYCSDDHKHHHAQICHLRGCVHLRTNDSHYCSPDHEQQHQVIKSARKGANAKKCRLKICQNIREPNIEYCSPAHAPERAFDMRQMGTQISMEPFQHITDQTCHLSGCVNTAVAPTNYCCVIHANMHAYAGGLHFLNHPDRPHLMHTDQTVSGCLQHTMYTCAGV
ncbi:hypothetical protein SARC_05084 [Sphaeroforma arctica JP610]|uniref:Uncharacterized protein n=1 Tax=Sphaeroforma arctica JP610 TaxID=667725 RepID=A0A0L0G1F1_9EUKA|nr:hypothetical protein SARC_05084 [Sphaeroforma arctica JP610]KNC82644.1 hypothetical protein SARC_05084 [Sphaeroforma arctica JP610]|eukprot:XP_014156546.1 hypothetical protein SARC_05084 [Sphaeroforma arctica JP610]